MAQRNTLDMMCDVLKLTVYEGRAPIMQKAFLSYSDAENWLSILKENGLVEFNKAGRTYKITEKDKEFLKSNCFP
ncbi:MAG: winged helix-turn-helix domain-containing protein [Nitrososphaera sp.]